MDYVTMVLGSRSFTVISQGTSWLVDRRNVCSIVDYMQALVVSGRASGLMFQCHETFILKVSQKHWACTNPTELDFVIHREN